MGSTGFLRFHLPFLSPVGLWDTVVLLAPEVPRGDRTSLQQGHGEPRGAHRERGLAGSSGFIVGFCPLFLLSPPPLPSSSSRF